MNNKKIIQELVKISLNENQILALDSFIACRGISAFKNSNLLKAINRKDKDLIPEEFLKWVVDNGKKTPVLEQARRVEIDLFFK